MKSLPSLPKFLLIADAFCTPPVREVVSGLLSSGLLPWLQLRDHAADALVFEKAVIEIVEDTRRRSPQTRISVNGHVELARKLNIGCHVGFRGPTPKQAREYLGPAALLGYSAHAVADVTDVSVSVVDYFTVSPIYTPVSKPKMEASGLDLLSSCVAAAARPVYALGGVTADRTSDCMRSGAYGVASVGGILSVNDPISTLTAYLRGVKVRSE
jgi:thiamine-phosphate diphosphorylase